MLTRSLILLKLSMSAFFHRLWHDLAREIVVALSSLIILATFFYVFNDFLNVEVASLSTAMREAFAKVASAIVLSGAAGLAGRLIQQERQGERTFTAMAKVLGEEPRIISLYAFLQGALSLITCHGIGWWFNQNWLYHLDFQAALATECGLMGVSILLASRQKKQSLRDDHDAVQTNTLFMRHDGGRVRTLIVWRLTQILLRSRLCRLSLIAAFLLMLPIAWSGLKGAPPFVAATCGLGVGFVGSLALIFFLSDDMAQAWTERGAGVSHQEFVMAYEGLAWVLGGGYASLSAALFWLTMGLGPHAPLGAAATSSPFAFVMISQVGKIFCTTLLPFLAVPWLMFQIDARRPWITAIISLLASLFVGTAILASWLGVLLVPFLRYYGLQSQNARFYRA